MIHQYDQKLSRFGITLFLLLFLIGALGSWIAAAQPAAVVYAASNQPDVALGALQTGPTIRFTSATVDVNENAGGAGNFDLTISVQLGVDPSTLTRPVTVTYRTVDGTANGGSDYVSLTDERIVYTTADGTNRIKTFTVTILQDEIPEADENFYIILQDPQNAVLGNPNVVEIEIDSEDPFPTNTPSSGSPTPIYADMYESNNTISVAYPLAVNSTAFCGSPNATLWPSGDIDFYKFWGKRAAIYDISAKNLDLGIDTIMTLYDTNGNYRESNDDFNGSRGSFITFSSAADGYHFIKIENKDNADPADKTYCVEVIERIPTSTPTNTPQPTATTKATLSSYDRCEDNSNFDRACTLGATDPPVAETFNFVPFSGTGPDNDFYRIWVKQGWSYTCETLNLSAVNDTNMILYDQNQNTIAGNDDKRPDDLGSLVSYYASYTGWLYILVGPYATPDYDDSPLYQYDLQCSATAATPTPTPRPTFPPNTGTGGGGAVTQPTATQPVTTPEPTIDIFATLTAAAPMSTPAPVVNIQPLPTATPNIAPSTATELNVILYYDANQNFQPELDEGIMDMAVSVYDGVTGQLLSLGYTNEAGMLRFSLVTSSNVLRVSIPFLGFNQTVATGTSEVRLRVVPQSVSSSP